MRSCGLAKTSNIGPKDSHAQLPRIAALAGITGMARATIGPGIFSVGKSVEEPKNEVGEQKRRLNKCRKRPIFSLILLLEFGISVKRQADPCSVRIESLI